MPIELKKLNKQKLSFFRFEKNDGQYLLTNDVGRYCFLSPRSFHSFITGELEQANPIKYQELKDKNFIKDKLDLGALIQQYADRKVFLKQGPSLHIVVVTLRCDHKCIYCQSSSKNLPSAKFDMSLSTAKQVVDKIFESTSPNITIEFQGGEPLLNFETIRFIADYADKKNEVEKKRLFISLVSNFFPMDEGKFDYLINKKVGMCTSLDGPEELHNKNRIYLGEGSSYRQTLKWIKKIKAKFDKGDYPHRPNALLTVSRHSLSYGKKIVDEYVNLGCELIHLRPVNPFGVAKKLWKKISYTPEDFFIFYKRTLEYIINLNLKGKRIYERTAYIFLRKILTDSDPNYVDLRSPCGAGIGQLAYNFNGDIYTCDEGRMFSRMGEELFKLGDVTTPYKKILNNDTVKSLCVASSLSNLANCYKCVYHPYCGVCPIYNYSEEGDIFSKVPYNSRCRINRSILGYIFTKIDDPKFRKVFDDWMKMDFS